MQWYFEPFFFLTLQKHLQLVKTFESQALQDRKPDPGIIFRGGTGQAKHRPRKFFKMDSSLRPFEAKIKVMTTLKSQKEQSLCDFTVGVFFVFILIMFLLIVIFCQVLSPLMDKCNVALDTSLSQHPFFSPVKANRYFHCIL